MYTNVNGVWKNASNNVNVNGVWKSAVGYTNVNGVWKQEASTTTYPKLSFISHHRESTYGYNDVGSTYLQVASGYTGTSGACSIRSSNTLNLLASDKVTIDVQHVLSGGASGGYGQPSCIYLSTSSSYNTSRPYLIYRTSNLTANYRGVVSFTMPSSSNNLYFWVVVEPETYNSQKDTQLTTYAITVNGQKIFA